jgi:hypothetical protein
MTRAVSTATTGGLANPVVSTFELGGAVLTSVLAVVAPVVAVLLLITLLAVFGRTLLRKFRNRSPGATVESGVSLTQAG